MRAKATFITTNVPYVMESTPLQGSTEFLSISKINPFLLVFILVCFVIMKSRYGTLFKLSGLSVYSFQFINCAIRGLFFIYFRSFETSMPFSSNLNVKNDQ